jgi:hypothetical protein
MADDADYEALRERVKRLEKAIADDEPDAQVTPSRRGLLQAGGLLAGGGVLGALGTGRASAADGTNDSSVGAVGASGQSVDVYLDQLLDPNGDEVVNIDETGAINAAASGREWRFDSVNTNANFSKSRSYEYIIREDSSGTVHVDGQDGEVANGSAASAIKSAAEANPSASFCVNGDVSVSSTINIDLGGAEGFTLVTNGQLLLDSGITYGLKVVNGKDVELDVAIGGGNGNYTYAKDFASNVSGLDTAVYLRGLNNWDLWFASELWKGRGVEIDEEQTDEPKTRSGKIHKFKGELGQSIHADVRGASFEFDGGSVIGEIDGGYFNANDLTISHYENIYTNPSEATAPVTFEDCLALNLSHVHLGATMDPLLKIVGCGSIDFGSLYLLGGSNNVDGAHIVDSAVMSGDIKTINCHGDYGLVLDGCQRGSIKHIDQGSTRALYVYGNSRDIEDLEVYELSKNPLERAVNIDRTSPINIEEFRLQGDLIGANSNSVSGESTLHVGAPSNTVKLDSVRFEGGDVDHYIDAPSNNNVVASNCEFVAGGFTDTKFSNRITYDNIQRETTTLTIAANSNYFVTVGPTISEIAAGEARERVLSVDVIPPTPSSGNSYLDYDQDGEASDFEVRTFTQDNGNFGVNVVNNTANEQTVKIVILYE